MAACLLRCAVCVTVTVMVMVAACLVAGARLLLNFTLWQPQRPHTASGAHAPPIQRGGTPAGRHAKPGAV
jgi:hypothetical protein